MSEETSADVFVRELTRNSPGLYSYIMCLVPNWADAEEVYQEVSATLWQKRDDFVPGTNFRAWAYRVASFKAREFYHAKPTRHFAFSDEFAIDLAEDHQHVTGEPDHRLEALAKCLAKLKNHHRELITLRYWKGSSVKSLAEDLGRNADAVYKALSRIHTSLLDCVQRTLTEDRR